MADLPLTPRQLALARHALGLPNGKRRSYRNHYVVGPHSSAHAEWTAMVADGLAFRNNHISGSQMLGKDDLFHLTRVGAEDALEPDETLDLEDFPDA